MTLTASAGSLATIAWKGTGKRAGKVKKLCLRTVKLVDYRDRARYEWVVMEFNRARDSYVKSHRLDHPETGEIVFHKCGSRRDQTLHGSAGNGVCVCGELSEG